MVTRTHVVSFAPEQTLVVPLHLLRTCVGKSCPAAQTCGEAGCEDQQLETQELLAWSGAPPSVADPGDVDCGETMPVDFATSSEHCGSCNNACRGNEHCSAGQCVKK
jgi:hypothetical protein